LLLLRVALGIGILMQAHSGIEGLADAPAAAWAAVCVAAVAAVALLIGFLTPVVALIAFATAVVWLWRFPGPLNLFTSMPHAVFVAIVALAVALLGPGAFSLDARVFGLREVIIPPYGRGSLGAGARKEEN
jgi:uncharacterized membrane protein YphA (DoxX/SURF4 family)